MSKRRAAGSRRNKKYKFVGIQSHDETGFYPLDMGMQPNHAARTCRVEGLVLRLGG